MRRMASIMARSGAAIAAAALAGCATPTVDRGPAGPDAHELANLDMSNLVPKSTARQLVRTFEDACLDGPRDPAQADASLRKAGFVPLPGTRRDAVAYVSDDRRPAVMLGADGRSCAVAAASRTGQTDALRRLVATRFPAARPVQVPGVEQAWTADGTTLFLKRIVNAPSPSRLIFGIGRAT